jgi:hypothetical protein
VKTVDYSLIYDNVLNLAGIEQDLDGVNQVAPGKVQWRLLRDFVNNRLKLGWNQARWPELCVIESRTVTQSGGVEGNYVALNQSGQNEIETVFEVWDKNPKTAADGTPVDYFLSENGIQLDTTLTAVWVHYRKQHPRLTGNLYSKATGTNYAVGEQAYDNNLGNFYTALEAITGDGSTDNSPNAQPSKWSLVELPDVLRNFLIRGTYADYLRHDGQMDKSHPAERDAQAALDQEVNQLETIQGQDVRYKVTGY